MKRPVLGLLFCLLLALAAAGCSRGNAGQVPQPVGGPTGLLMDVDGMEAQPSAEGPEEEPAEREPEEAVEEVKVSRQIEVEPALTLEEVRTVRFQDVPPEDERADYISYAACRGYMQGADGGCFQPDGFVTRAGLMAVLHRMSGAGESNVLVLFADVEPDAWYVPAISWAAESGIAAGGEDGTFAPEDRVTREQLAVFLHRFAAYEDGKAYDEALADYQDGASIPAYAREALAWALENRIFAGMVGDTIHPGLPVSRGQLAQALAALAAYSEEEPVARELTDRLYVEVVESVSREKHEDIQAKVDAVAARYGAAGLQVAVIESGQLTDTYAYGWATKGVDRMTPDHKIRIASLTKAGVGVAAMVLYEDGVIDLDKSIGAYWDVQTKNPCYPDDPVTIRTLLTHTSSIPVLGDDASRTMDAVRSRLRSNAYSRVRPGAVSSWAYNNYAFGVLGQTLELASGKYLDDIMHERLWDIMEIDAAFESGNIRDKSLLATVYQYGGVGRSASAMANNIRRGQPGATGIYFSGGMTISAADLGKMTALLANGGCYEGLHLLQKETVETMESRCEPQLPDGSWQALALRSQDDIYGRDRLYYHTGSAYGVFNWISYDPATGDGVVVLSTGASGVKDSRNIYSVCGEISQYIYETIA